MRGKRQFTGSVILVTVLLLLAGCGSRSGELTDPTAQLSWPPADELARSASADSVVILGREAAAQAGVTLVGGQQLKLGPAGGVLTWARYSLQGFGPEVELAHILPDFTVSGATTRLTFGLANYELGRWEWFELDPSAPDFGLADYSAYISPGGAVHVAAALSGSGFGRVRELRFERAGPGANVPVPTGFSGLPLPGRITLRWDAVPYAQGYHLYRSTNAELTDEVRLGPAQGIVTAHFTDTSMTKFTPYWYRVSTLRGGQESAKSVPLALTALDAAPDAPRNLRATVEVGTITLAWDPPLGATNYTVERSERRQFDLLQTFSVSQTQLVDTTVQAGRMYYYRVIANAAAPSPPSEYLDAFAPHIDLPASPMFEVVSDQTSGDYVRLGWDWKLGDGPPWGFRIWLHTEPDFAIDGQVMTLPWAHSHMRHITRFDLPPDTVFYARMVALGDFDTLGRVTPAVEFRTGKYWTWDDVEEIGSGEPPLRLVSDGTDLTLACFEGTVVRGYRRDSGTWTQINIGSLNIDMRAPHLDMAVHNGLHVIAAKHQEEPEIGDDPIPPPELVISVGMPGDTFDTFTLTHTSGDYPAVAVNDSQISVLSLNQLTPNHGIDLTTRDVGGGLWETEMLTTTKTIFAGFSLLYRDTATLDALWYDGSNLRFGSSETGFNWTRVNPQLNDAFGVGPQLQSWNGRLLSPVIEPTTNSLFVLESTTMSDFSATSVVGGFNLFDASLATTGEHALMVFMRPTNPMRPYSCSYVDGSWEPASLVVPGRQNPGLRIVAHQGDFYVIYRNEDGVLRCARGIPPQ